MPDHYIAAISLNSDDGLWFYTGLLSATEGGWPYATWTYDGNTSSRVMYSPVYTGLESQSIDQKIDDGIPKTGRVKAVLYDSGGSTTGTNAEDIRPNKCVVDGSATAYNATNDAKMCNLIIRAQ